MLFTYNNQRYEGIEKPNGRVYIYKWDGVNKKDNINNTPSNDNYKILTYFLKKKDGEVL